MAKKIGVLVELDYCVGCSACQMACQNYYDLPVTDTYMRVFLGKPDVIDGKHEMFMSPYAYRLDKCANCLEKEGGQRSLRSGLHLPRCVGELDEINKLADTTEGHLAIYR